MDIINTVLVEGTLTKEFSEKELQKILKKDKKSS